MWSPEDWDFNMWIVGGTQFSPLYLPTRFIHVPRFSGIPLMFQPVLEHVLTCSSIPPSLLTCLSLSHTHWNVHFLCVCFVWLRGVQVAMSRGCSLVVARGLLTMPASLVGEPGLQSKQVELVWRTGLAALCANYCVIFPDKGLNPWPLYWQADS